MNLQTWTSRWWEVVVGLYAVTQAVFGVVVAGNGYPGWAIVFGFAPAALLLGGLVLRERRRALATGLIVVATLLPCVAFWAMYPFVLLAVIVGGGLWSGKIGRTRAPEPASA